LSKKAAKEIRVRFAPSPTGYLHVGGARTAIFNWLFARKQHGKFLLRIEDTDVARSGEEMVQAIFNGLKWLGLNWDETAVFQSSRFDIYKKFAEQLVAEKKAYKCFCSPEKLQASRDQAIKEKRTPKYDRTCMKLTDEEIRTHERAGTPYVIRLRVREGVTNIKDEVFGDVKFDNRQLDDFILLRADGHPTYHLAVVVDDKEMRISHVIRGDDHLSNTPKHVLLYEAFGWECPSFAHLPLILGPDKQRLSKRHGATAIEEYEKAGYLPEAVLNFLTLLGWSPGDDQEIFSREELIKKFDLSGVSKKSAVFDERKLEWMNGQYLNRMTATDFLKLMSARLVDEKLITPSYAVEHQDSLLKIAGLIKARVKRLTDIPTLASYFFKAPEIYEESAVQKHWQDSELVSKFQRLIDKLSKLSRFDAASIEQAFRGLADELNIPAANLIHPARVAVTGYGNSPGLFEIMEILGKESVLKRLERAMNFLQFHSTAVYSTAEE
jgi:glutamyl-tRNA synthetase